MATWIRLTLLSLSGLLTLGLAGSGTLTAVPRSAAGPGHNGVSTSDEWTVQSSGVTTRLNSVKAVSHTVAWACGNSGVVLRTTDNGSTWQGVGGGLLSSMTLYSIEAIDANTAIVAAWASSGAYLLRTTDGGAMWDTVFTQPGGFINGIKMFDAQNGIAEGDPVGNTWTIVRTTDGGGSWARIANEPAQTGAEYGAVNGMAVWGNSNAWFTPGSSTNRIYRTTDGGLTWNASTLPWSEFTAAIAFLSAQVGVAGPGSGARIARTTDGGATWEPPTAVVGGSLYGMAAAGPDLYAATGTSVIKSSDGGLSWVQSYGGSVGQIEHVSFFTSGGYASGWIVSRSGGIAAFYGLVTAIEEPDDQVPAVAVLHQNYPNPFNPQTTIGFSLSQAARVTLSVFNPAGICVALLLDERRAPGNHTVSFDGSGLASGVYFYRLQAGEYTCTRKMVILR